MKTTRFAVIGIGATGTVLAAALLRGGNTDTVLAGSGRMPAETILKNGLRISGALEYKEPVTNYVNDISDLRNFNPQVIFITTKTFHLGKVLASLEGVADHGAKIVSCQNGLGPEDIISERFGTDSVFRMSLNYGVSTVEPGKAEVVFFNKPNQLGALSPVNRDIGSSIAQVLTHAGLDTEFVDDIKFHVWKKMIMKCTMASICAITDMTIKDALGFSPTREIAETCFKEAIAVARAMGYDLGNEYIHQAMDYLARVGGHRDSMCYDIAGNRPTEIDFLGGKVVDYGKQHGVSTPFFIAMTNLVNALEIGVPRIKKAAE
jgi:2-dehydropantoate 2-reductase